MLTRGDFGIAHVVMVGATVPRPASSKKLASTRAELLLATECTLARITARVAAGTLSGQGAIGVRVGKVVNRYKVAKHVALTIGDQRAPPSAHSYSSQPGSSQPGNIGRRRCR